MKDCQGNDMKPEFALSYWKIVAAIGRALHAVGDEETNLHELVQELQIVYPNFDWRNSLTDRYYLDAEPEQGRSL